MDIYPAEKKVSGIISVILNPLLIPTLAISYIVFTPGIFSSMLPLKYRIMLLGLIALMTIIIPLLLFAALKWFNLLSNSKIPEKSSKNYVYIILLICYFFTYRMLISMGFNNAISLVLLGSTIALFICAAINLAGSMSATGVGWGALSGIILSMLLMDITSGITILLLIIILSGISGTAQILLGRSTASQEFAGFATGVVALLFTFIVLSGMV